MKRLLTTIFLFSAIIITAPAVTPADTDSIENLSTAQLVQRTQKAKRHKDYLTAMVHASELLSRNQNNSYAKNFVHDNWGMMMQQVDEIISQNTDMEDVEQCANRTRAYSLLADVERRINTVSMPLRGNGWQWQPEMLYTAGEYQSERMHLSRLVRAEASKALQGHDAEALEECYRLLLASDLLFPEERQSNRQLLLADCNAKIEELTSGLDEVKDDESDELDEDSVRRLKHRLNDLLFADELMPLSLMLEPNQPTIEEKQIKVKTEVSRLYLQLSTYYLQQGDTLQAQTYRSAAE